MDSRKRTERTKERIPHKTRWALEAIQAETCKLRRNWDKHVEHAKKKADLESAFLLMEQRDSIAEIERLALGAVHGDFLE